MSDFRCPTQIHSVVAKEALNTFNLKIVKASMQRRRNGKVDFQHESKFFVEVVESTANMDYILGAVQRKWGADPVIVTIDGLTLEDLPATQGLETALH